MLRLQMWTRLLCQTCNCLTGRDFSVYPWWSFQKSGPSFHYADNPVTEAKQYFKTAVFTNRCLARNSVGRSLAEALTLSNDVELGCIIMSTWIKSTQGCHVLQWNQKQAPTPCHSAGIFLQWHQNIRTCFKHSPYLHPGIHFILGLSLQNLLRIVQYISFCFIDYFGPRIVHTINMIPGKKKTPWKKNTVFLNIINIFLIKRGTQSITYLWLQKND